MEWRGAELATRLTWQPAKQPAPELDVCCSTEQDLAADVIVGGHNVIVLALCN
jgi:hypothetical protein